MAFCIWDLDKSFLDTPFEELSELVKIPLQTAEERKSVVGAAELSRALQENGNSLAFVSGSPELLRGVIEEKFRLERLKIESLTLKDPLRELARGRGLSNRSQFAYKLRSLLSVPGLINQQLILFGDDFEIDPEVYYCFAQILSGQYTLSDLRQILIGCGCSDRSINTLISQAVLIRENALVKRIFIRRAASSRQNLHHLSSLIVHVDSWYQAALVLYLEELITKEEVFAIQSACGLSDFSVGGLFQSLVLNTEFDEMALSRCEEFCTAPRLNQIVSAAAECPANKLFKRKEI